MSVNDSKSPEQICVHSIDIDPSREVIEKYKTSIGKIFDLESTMIEDEGYYVIDYGIHISDLSKSLETVKDSIKITDFKSIVDIHKKKLSKISENLKIANISNRLKDTWSDEIQSLESKIRYYYSKAIVRAFEYPGIESNDDAKKIPGLIEKIEAIMTENNIETVITVNRNHTKEYSLEKIKRHLNSAVKYYYSKAIVRAFEYPGIESNDDAKKIPGLIEKIEAIMTENNIETVITVNRNHTKEYSLEKIKRHLNSAVKYYYSKAIIGMFISLEIASDEDAKKVPGLIKKIEKIMVENDIQQVSKYFSHGRPDHYSLEDIKRHLNGKVEDYYTQNRKKRA